MNGFDWQENHFPAAGICTIHNAMCKGQMLLKVAGI